MLPWRKDPNLQTKKHTRFSKRDPHRFGTVYPQSVHPYLAGGRQVNRAVKQAGTHGHAKIILMGGVHSIVGDHATVRKQCKVSCSEILQT